MPFSSPSIIFLQEALREFKAGYSPPSIPATFSQRRGILCDSGVSSLVLQAGGESYLTRDQSLSFAFFAT